MIEIKETKINKPNTQQKQKSLVEIENILSNSAEWLKENSSSYIKSYGLSSLATLSIRGGSSNQNIILWEYTPISNPMLGLTDLALIPLDLFDKVQLNYGGQSSTLGSGAITGNLQLTQASLEKDKPFIELSSSYGSFNQSKVNVGFNFSKTNLTFNTKAFLIKARNDFEYHSKGSQVSKKITNNEIDSKGLLSAISYQQLKHNFALQLWLQRSFRQIPPTSVQNLSEANQTDIAHRYLLSWNYKSEDLKIRSSLSFIDEENLYSDPVILLDANNRFKKLNHNLLISHSLNESTKIKASYSISTAKGISDNYSNEESFNVFSPTISISKKWKQSELKIVLHKPWSNYSDQSIIPAFEYDFDISKSAKARIYLSKEYRLPTLNELFWRPGGNLELLAENGWNQEFDLHLFYIKNIRISSSIYHRMINNWILWGKLENQNIWSVHNLTKVRSYGYDINLISDWTHRSIVGKFELNYSYTKAKNLLASETPKLNQGEQLLYTSVHSYSSQLYLNFKQSSLKVFYNATGKVRGINQELEAYSILSAELGHLVNFRKLKLFVALTTKNVLDNNYRVIEYRPMPGRHYLIHLNFHFK